jgi:hypothetical protein
MKAKSEKAAKTGERVPNPPTKRVLALKEPI